MDDSLVEAWVDCGMSIFQALLQGSYVASYQETAKAQILQHDSTMKPRMLKMGRLFHINLSRFGILANTALVSLCFDFAQLNRL